MISKTEITLFGSTFLFVFGAMTLYSEYKQVRPDYTITLTEKVHYPPVMPPLFIPAAPQPLKAQPAVLKPAPSKVTYSAQDDSIFWDKMHQIESLGGMLKYQGDDKDCKTTRRYCGHFQIGYEALKDINCTSAQCKADRDDYDKSLAMAKQILKKKLARFEVAENWLKYTLYQQGANGLKEVHRAAKGQVKLSKAALKRLARNSMYTVRELKMLGSKKAAKSYLNEWKKRWDDAGSLKIASGE
jgi:hypothetical protein